MIQFFKYRGSSLPSLLPSLFSPASIFPSIITVVESLSNNYKIFFFFFECTMKLQV